MAIFSTLMENMLGGNCYDGGQCPSSRWQRDILGEIEGKRRVSSGSSNVFLLYRPKSDLTNFQEAQIDVKYHKFNLFKVLFHNLVCLLHVFR